MQNFNDKRLTFSLKHGLGFNINSAALGRLLHQLCSSKLSTQYFIMNSSIAVSNDLFYSFIIITIIIIIHSFISHFARIAASLFDNSLRSGPSRLSTAYRSSSKGQVSSIIVAVRSSRYDNGLRNSSSRLNSHLSRPTTSCGRLLTLQLPTKTTTYDHYLAD